MTEIKQAVKSICELLNKHQVEYIIIGGFAVIYHGYPRSTADLDFWYAPTTENFIRLIAAFQEHGVDTSDLKTIVFDPDKTYLRIPALGFRTEFLPSLPGFKSFYEVKKRADRILLDEVPVSIISYEDLLKNKSTVGRLKDQLDIEELKKRKENRDK